MPRQPRASAARALSHANLLLLPIQSSLEPALIASVRSV
jgi:hypothetical protein